MALLGALGHLANLGQFVEIGQGHAHQREQIRWTRRNYSLDAQALKIDLLGAARDDVRGTYDTYMESLNTLLLLNGLLMPFALNTLQFSDQFVPRTAEQCEHDQVWCVEGAYPWLTRLWVYNVGASLVLPFWSILLLLRCKVRLDNWLRKTLDALQVMRRDILAKSSDPASMRVRSGLSGGDLPQVAAQKQEELIAREQERIVSSLGEFIVGYQDQFTQTWVVKCAPLLTLAQRLLYCSLYVALLLTGMMFWTFLIDRVGEQNSDHYHFLAVLALGLLTPVVVLVVGFFRRERSPSAVGTGVPDLRGPAQLNVPMEEIASLTQRSSLFNRKPSSTSAAPSNQTPLSEQLLPGQGANRFTDAFSSCCEPDETGDSPSSSQATSAPRRSRSVDILPSRLRRTSGVPPGRQR